MAALPTILQTIRIGDGTVPYMGNYEAEGTLFGQRLVKKDTTILVAIVTDALRWQNESFPTADAVGAIGSLLMTFIGFVGDTIEVFCLIPGIGSVSFGTYERQSGDIDTEILATNIANALSYSGFSFSSENSTVNIGAPSFLGASINGGSNLSVVFTPTTTSPAVYIVDLLNVTSTTIDGYGNTVTNGVISFFDDSGFCVSTSPNPTLADTVFTIGGAGSGNYSLMLTGLTPGTLYYIVAYGTYNTTETIYSEQQTFTTL